MQKEFKRAKLVSSHPSRLNKGEDDEEKARNAEEAPDHSPQTAQEGESHESSWPKLEINAHAEIVGEARERTADHRPESSGRGGGIEAEDRQEGRESRDGEGEDKGDKGKRLSKQTPDGPEGNGRKQSADEDKTRKMKAETHLSEEERRLKEAEGIPGSFDRLKRQLEERVGLNKSFDVVFREMVFGGQPTAIFYYNGFAKDTVLTDILMRLSYADAEHRPPGDNEGRSGGRESEERAGHRTGDEQPQLQAGEKRTKDKAEASEGSREHEEKKTGGRTGKLNIIDLFDHALIPHIQVKKTSQMKEVIDNVSMGGTAFFFEGEEEAVLVDAKSFPVRSTEEPDLERVVRGSRDGFVETLLTNVTLVRRRLRDPRLKLEITQVGKRTQTDVCIGYIQDICDMNMVEAVRDKIKQVEVDGLPLAEKQLEEAIIGKGWNPYPSVRYSERPDVVAAHLLEGHLAVFVDTSPSVMITPATFFHHVQHAEEYRQTPLVGSYLRWVRFLGIAASLFLLPLWFLIVTSPDLKPIGLDFIGPQKVGKIPMILQFLIAELGIDLMRMAAIHTPTPLATAMGLVAAILIGDIAVKTGLFVNEVILYLAVAAIGTFATPSYELSLANRLARLVLLIAAAIFKVPGLVVASTGLVLLLALQRSYNTPYLWPLLPFNAKAMLDVLIRRPFLSMRARMSLTKTADSTRQPSPEPGSGS